MGAKLYRVMRCLTYPINIAAVRHTDRFREETLSCSLFLDRLLVAAARLMGRASGTFERAVTSLFDDGLNFVHVFLEALRHVTFLCGLPSLLQVVASQLLWLGHFVLKQTVNLEPLRLTIFEEVFSHK